MFNLFARLDPLAGARLRGALFAKADELFRAEDPQQRATPQQRLADALEQLACHPNTNTPAGDPPTPNSSSSPTTAPSTTNS